MKGYHFSELEEVAHVDCLQVKMRVKKLIWKYVDVPNGIPKNPATDGFNKEKKKLLDAIQTEWWEDGKFKTGKFHSKMLVPWFMAEKGKQAVEEWLEEMQ